MKIPLLLLPAVFLLHTVGFTQLATPSPEDNPLIITDTRCGTVEHHDWLKTQYPDEFAQDDEFEAWLREAMVQMKAERSAQMPVATIPIIFHVVHNNGPDNIAATYINAQIEQLNFDYRKTPGTSGDNSNPVGADTEIEFCPAAIDPNGNALAEPGINRILASSAGLTNPPYGPNYIDNTIKPTTIWDPEQYFNVWVMNLGYGLLGYAQFPSNSTLPGPGGGAANTDGCVILYSAVGSTTTPYPTGGPYAAGRTLTHEAGHWLGLVHIWGDSFCGDDYCADTPQSQGANFGCPNSTTCDGIQDMVENYMDYSDDACFNIFTFDQKDRMMTVLMNSPRRVNLLTSTVCNVNLDCVGFTTTTNSTNATTCAGGDGTATITPASGLAPYTYQWSANAGGQNTQTATGLTAGTYAVTVNDQNNCELVESITVNGPPVPMQGSTILTPTTCAQGDGSISISFMGGTPPYQYSIDGGVTFVTSGSFAGLSIGTYTIQGLDASGCTVAPISLEILDGCNCAINATISTVNATCGEVNGSATVNVVGGDAPFSYTWSSGGNTQTINGLSPGTYTVTIMDAIGCDVISSATVNDVNILDVQLATTDIACNGDNNGSASVTTTGAINYVWSNGGAGSTINGLSGGTYTVTATQGTCTDIESVTVNEPTVLNGNVLAQDSPCSDNNGAATAIGSGGTPPFSYTWNTGDNTQTIGGLVSGSYTVTIVDSNNCAATSGGTVNSQNSGPVVILTPGSQSSVSCPGNSDGAVDISITAGTPPITYSWSNGASTEDLSNVPADVYTVVATDANGCIGVLSVLVSEPSPMSLNYNAIPSSGNDGMASVNVSGGAPPYTYQWSNGQTGQTATGLSPGTYTVAVTDANNCTVNGSVSIEVYTGTYDLENLNSFELYPNPSDGEFTIALDFNAFEKADLAIYSVLGQGIIALYVEGTNLQIPVNISEQAAGTYFIIIKTDKGQAVKKFSLIH